MNTTCFTILKLFPPKKRNLYMTMEAIAQQLNLIPHPEGGYFKETLRINQNVCRIEQDGSTRDESYSAGSSIYYLLGSQSRGHFSAWHRLRNELSETWNYHAGVPLTIYCLMPDGTLQTNMLGLGKAASPQVHIPAGCWFAAVVEDPDPTAFTLSGCVVFPGFDFNDFELANRALLISQFPQHKEIIERLTRTE
jgi:predicted cupin superfamily sugar epimerase